MGQIPAPDLRLRHFGSPLIFPFLRLQGERSGQVGVPVAWISSASHLRHCTCSAPGSSSQNCERSIPIRPAPVSIPECTFFPMPFCAPILPSTQTSAWVLCHLSHKLISLFFCSLTPNSGLSKVPLPPSPLLPYLW